VIERLVVTLRAIGRQPPDVLASADSAPLLADCADALRLELDCPQQTLTLDQRSTLEHLGDLLDDPAPDPDHLRAAVTHACAALGLLPAEFR
jgi:hypothetical protein